MICPNCGANLPNTVSMCHSCRMVFKPLPQMCFQPQMSQPQFQSFSAYYVSGLILGIAAGLLLLVSPFLPYYTLSFMRLSESYTLNDIVNYYIIEAIILCLGLIIDSIVKHGFSNIGVGIIILIICIVRYKNFIKVVTEQNLKSFAKLNIGYYFIAFSAILAIISGVLLILHKELREKARRF